MSKAKIGDMIEIETRIGLYYAQYTHKVKDYGELIQVTKKYFKERPTVETMLSCEVGIITFFPLNLALKEREFRLIGNTNIPETRRQFPIFRVLGYSSLDGSIKKWKFWDGESVWPDKYVENLSDEQQRLPVRGIYNKAFLIERLEECWTPEMFGK